MKKAKNHECIGTGSSSKGCTHKVFLCCLIALACSSGSIAQEPGIDISGANEPLSANIESLVNLPNQACDTDPSALRRFLPDLRQQTVRAGRALGYYFLIPQLEFQRDENCWNLNIAVDPGEPVRISEVNVRVDGNSDLFRETLSALPVSVDDQLNHASYERIKSDLSARAVELGFFSARYTRSELRLDLQRNNAAIDIQLDPGQRFQFGQVEIQNTNALSTDFIQRFVNIQPDQYYSANALLEIRNSLNDSQYFEDVSVTPALDRASDLRIPIQVGLQLRPRRLYSVGGGVTTDIGPRIRFDYEDRYLNRSGHQLELNTGVSPIQQVIDTNYSIPMRNPATERLTFLGGFLREDNDTFNSRTSKLGVNYGFLNNSEWRQNIFVNFQHDDFTINEESEKADFLIPGINMARTRADDALYPQRGWRLFAELSGASNALLSNESFLQLSVNGKLINPLGPGRVILKFEAGTTYVDDLHELPVSIRFFGGGDQSVRGYQYQSLGPLNEIGEVEGGKHLLTGGIEYDFNILPNWKLAVFADAGNAFSDFNDYDLDKGVGIGVRWMSPLGPIRIDLASALDDDNDLRVHITMGPDL